MRYVWPVLVAGTVLLAACGDESSSVVTDNSATPGALQISPPFRVASINQADFTARLKATASGQQLLTLATTPKCGIDIHYLKYATKGGADEPTSATGAMIVPTGTDPACTGPRPMVLYAHGTTTSRGYNIADITDPNNAAAGELGLIAAMFAAQGYIVVAPNYAGYDTSPLTYHPYLNAKQQAGEMIDSLKAARKALPNVPAGVQVSDNGKLFVTGYSEGGHVAMATMKAMQEQKMTVTAGAPLSGPYAMAMFGDAVFGGNVNVGGTVFGPLLATSYQRSYGNIYSQPSDLYAAPYSGYVDSLLPSSMGFNELLSSGKLPQTALFEQTPSGIYASLAAISPASPTFAFAFAPSNYLISTPYRAGYLADAQANPDGAIANTTFMPAAAPAHPLRSALKKNDLRGYIPAMPMLMCGGGNDPTVFFKNTDVMAGLLSAAAGSGAPVKFAKLDVDGAFASTGLTPTQTAVMSGTATALQAGFAQAKAAVAAGAGADPAAQAVAVASSYHGSLVPPFCTTAARAFFNQF